MRALLRNGPVMRHLGYFATEAEGTAAVAAARAEPARVRSPPPQQPSVPSVTWHRGRWYVRGVAGSFAALEAAEEACRRKPRVNAMHGSRAKKAKRSGPEGDKSRAALVRYKQWAAAEVLQFEGGQPWAGMLAGKERNAAVRAELKRRWKDQHSREEEAGAQAGGAGTAYSVWARRERARLMASDSLAGLDRVERAGRARQQLKALWQQEKERQRVDQDVV